MKDFNRVVAFLFHPLFMPLYGGLIVMNFVTYFDFAINPWIKGFVYMVLAVNVLAPAVSLGTMVSRKVVSNVQVSNRTERFIPLILTLIYYSVSYALIRVKLKSIYIPEEIYSMLLGVIGSLIIALIVTTKFKISLHSIGVSGVLGAVTALATKYQFDLLFSEFFWIYLLIGLFGLVGFSRIYTGNHSLSQVLWGGCLGFLVNYLAVVNMWVV